MSTRADDGDPELVVVCGLPGVGKTTVSETVADRLDADRLRTDVVRKELIEDPEYTEEEVGRVYDEVFSRARDRLESGRFVVLDGTFKRAGHREQARALAADLGVTFRLVRVTCEADVVRERIEAREGDESDADFEIYKLYRREFEPVDAPHVTVDNSGDVEEAVRRVENALFE